MFINNPFSELSELIPSFAMQAYVVVMFLLVVGGTLLDVIHKKSAQYFFENTKKAEKSRKRELGGGERISIAVQTLAADVLASAEFCNQRRRIAHLLTMYGFILFVVTSAVMVFAFPAPDASGPGILALLWHLGAAMVCYGGYWFWFRIRVDVAAEGNPWHRVMQADLFILSLLGTTTFGLLWSIFQAIGLGGLSMLFFVLFIVSSLVLFGGVLWSKFAHMFFKPAAAFQKRMIKADGSNENLPELGELTDPDLQKRYPDIPEYMGANPPYMGLGIKREAPRHY